MIWSESSPVKARPSQSDRESLVLASAFVIAILYLMTNSHDCNIESFSDSQNRCSCPVVFTDVVILITVFTLTPCFVSQPQAISMYLILHPHMGHGFWVMQAKLVSVPISNSIISCNAADTLVFHQVHVTG